ncbi:MAG: hypothetical protein ACLTYN_03540 [Dysosmobacter welbionis]
MDECHVARPGGEPLAADLEYFSGATQIGMTATPKETETTSLT